MRLAILGTRGIPARYGGFERFAEEIATRLAARGVDVAVFCPTDCPRADEEYRGVRLTYVKVPCSGPFEQVLWDAKCLYVVKGQFDVVYMLGVGASFAAWIPRLSRSTVWINSDGLEWRRAKWNLFQKVYLLFAEVLAVLFASRVIADSPAIETYLRKRYPGIGRVSTIAYGAYPVQELPDPAALSEWALRSQEYYIVVCRLEPENHLLEIVRGYEKSQTNRPLVILGDIKNPNAYVKELLKHQSDRIRFIGTVFDDHKLVTLRSHARAYIHGHSVGGTNPSLLEAMACSSLVIAHDNPFNREVLDGSGVFFKNSDEMAAAVNAVEGCEIDIDSLRKAVLNRIQTNYRWDLIADAYDELLSRAR